MSCTWEEAVTKGTPPEPRSGHSLTAMPGNKCFLFGGCGRGRDGKAQAFGDLWSLDMTNADCLVWARADVAGGPSARSKHTCTPIDKRKFLIYGGLNGRTRYSDLWIFDIHTKTWEQPKCEGEPPPSRAHHSATLIGNKLYVFGGYGGHGRTYSDLWILDLGNYFTAEEPEDRQPLSWSSPEILKGKGPAPRFDHGGTTFGGKLVIFGGRDNSTMYKDIHVLNIETLTWLDDPRAVPPDYLCEITNHQCEAIESVPNYKLFCITGKTGTMTYSNTVDVLDCGTLVWNSPQVIGAPFAPREDTAMAYDSKTARLVFFGGWSNRWLGDTWTLNVSPIIGPPYACMAVEPDIGPVAGDTPLKIGGIRFKDGSKIEIKFGLGKNEIIVPGTFVDASTITCNTPNYEAFGAMEVDLRVNINGEGWTVNKVKFSYFANTHPGSCLAFGPALQPKVVYGITMPFSIIAKDTCNARRQSGGDVFVVRVQHETDPKVLGDVRIVDHNNGHYEVFICVPAAGKFRVDVGHDDGSDPKDIQPIRGSPFTILAEDPWTAHRATGLPPLKRKGAQATQVNPKLLAVWGGDESLTVLNTGAETWNWETVETEGRNPEPRKGHLALPLPGDSMAIFGGTGNAEGVDLNDFQVLSYSKGAWKWAPVTPKPYLKRDAKPRKKPAAPKARPSQVEDGAGGEAPPAEGGEHPPAEGGEAAAPAPAEGGEEHAAGEGEEHEAAPAAPAEPNLAPPKVKEPGQPAPRYGLGGVVVSGKKLFMFGGESNGTLENEFLTVDLAGDPQWVECKVAGEEEPEPRVGASVTIVGQKLYIFGGKGRDHNEEDFMHTEMAVVTVDAASSDVTVEPEVKTKGMVPAPRMGAVFFPLPHDKLLLIGGAAMDGAVFNDAYILDVKTLSWSRIYQAAPELLPPGGFVGSFLNSRILSLSCSPGSARLDLVQSIDAVAISDSYGFVKFMTDASGRELAALEKFVQESLVTFKGAQDLTKLAADFSQLMKVMETLFQVKSRRGALDLTIDTLRETLGLLAKHKVSVAAKEKALAAVEELWTGLKKMLPSVKADVQPIQDIEGERIKVKVQDFTEKASAFRKQFLTSPMFVYATGFKSAYAPINQAATDIAALNDELSELRNLADAFECPELMEPPTATMAECREDLLQIKEVWDMAAVVEQQFASWRQTLWSDIRTDMMDEGSKAFQKEVKNLPKKVRDRDAYLGLDTSVKNFITTVPLVADLRSPSMRDRHWKQLMDATKVEIVINDAFKLDDLLKLELHKYEEEVGEIVDRAQKEEKMEMSLKKLDEVWSKLEFDFHQHKDTDVFVAKLAEENFEVLEDNQVVVQGMMANRYMKTFEEPILTWNKKLNTVADVNQILSEIQRTWAYLEALFIHSEEVKKELPEAAARFKGIDEQVKVVLATAKASRNVVAVCTADGLFKNLERQQGELEICEKALADYMESKRRAFPRFYFVSTADLLDILSNGNNPVKVMGHMSKCFQAIEKLELDTTNPPPGTRPKGSGMHSCVGKEYVAWSSPLTLDGKVEVYMNTIVDKMRGELKTNLENSMKAYDNPKPRHEWLFDWTSQMILVVNQIYWCQEVEQAFADMSAGKKDAMKEYNQKQIQQLTDLIRVTRTDVPKDQRQKVMNMITIDAHSRDVIQVVIESGAQVKTAFQWLSQLRTYWDSSINDSLIRICDAFFPYGYEYLGNGPRLVITPLTDRIYITATQACWLSLGTAPAGPAGTGKTESSKDLASQLGKSMYVFNCAPEMDYRTMGDIFKGLAASGSWGCFDEFNRLVPEVLSVCSVQYKCVTDSQKRKTLLPGRGLDHVNAKGEFVQAIQNWKFVAADGIEMPLEEGTSAFITMNPGYIGRAELPESLKALFRPITVMVPDRQLIMENMLMAEGFVEAKMLAKKFAALYYLLEDMLSPQKHYDWGLRAIKSVLVVAGSLLRAEEGQVEADVLFRALRDFNIPKIITADMVIFMGLLNDLFPGTDPPRKRDIAFEQVIADTAKEMGLTAEADFVLRVVQMSELLAIRHCIFLMGPTGVGRTEAYRVLAKAMEKGVDGAIVNDYLRANNKRKITIRDINPKSVSTQEFYGYVNLATREWKDGLMSYYMRELANVPNEDPKWILLDGDLDANWIESMNSVMDDNRLLTLPSNERIRLLPHMKLIFEIRDLKFATPATATRAGILYVSEGQQWNNMVQSWIKRVVVDFANKAKFKDPQQPVKWMTALFDKYVPATIFEMKKSYAHITPLATMNWITTLVNILEGMLKPENLNSKSEQPLFEQYFVMACIWAFGGGLAPKDGIEYRKNFDKWWKTKWTAVKFPGKGTVYDFYINPKTGKFAQWSDLVTDVAYDSRVTPMGSVFVPTAETASFSYFLDMMLSLRKPIMFVGPAGTGKTQIVKGKLAALPEGFMSMSISFNYFTDVISFQKNLESQLEKKMGINYGPPGTNKLIYFVDDLNMPKLDPYETAMPISLIRQHLGWGHWYDRAKLTQKNIQNTQYVACMNPTAGAFLVNPRLQRLFMTLAVDFPGQDSLMKIYGTFLMGHLQHFKDDCQELGTKIIQAALANHEKVVSSFRKTAVNFHYEFTVRHLSNVFQGLLMSSPEQFNDPVKLSRLWLHESERVYADRLVSYEDLATYNKNVQSVAGKFFKINDLAEYYKKEDPKPLIFSHFAGGMEERVYNEIKSFASMQKILEGALGEYNETNPVMDLVLFEDAMKHIARISRIISNPGGHALLVGVGGSGKQSLAKLAAFICGMATVMIVISSSYNLSSLREDLQKMYKRAGIKGEGIMWLFTDSQITDERFMVYINDLLSSGEIPDMFAAEDKDEIINSIRAEVKGAGLPDTRESCWDFFIQKVRRNLHMVFTSSPVGDQFRIRAQRFLAMINSTVIDWFQPWPEKALMGVSKRFLDGVDLGSDDVKKVVVEFMPYSFSSVGQASKRFLEREKRYNYTTPKTFLELIKLYKNILRDKREKTQAAIDRLQNGLDKLAKTQKDVDVLMEEARAKAVEVEAAVVSADAFAEKVGVEKANASVENDAAQVEAEKCAVIAKEVGEKQASCEADLAAAEPLVEQALKALDTLNKKDLGEAKSLKKPPQGVDDITAVIVILLENNPKDKSWGAATRLMSNVDKFMERLKDFKSLIDDGKVAPKTVDACRSYLALEWFNRDIIYNKSRAAAGLCEFAINIIKYYDVVAMVEPKRIELAEANRQLDEANQKLKLVQDKVAALNALVADLERQFAEAVKEKEDALAEQDRVNKKLDLANRLINALAASAETWRTMVQKLKQDYTVLVGDMLLAAAFVSYCGPFTAGFRKELTKQWTDYLTQNNAPLTAGIDPLKALVDDVVVAGWVSEGLPSDRTSVENGTITTNGERWPLMCDPQLQGIAWVKSREAKNNLKVVRMGNPKTVGIMEKALEDGHTVLIENMAESIDAVLMPVVTRSKFKKGRSYYVKMGDKDVEYNPSFKLYMHTKLQNPHYPPEVQAETTLVNFTVTQNGLEDQLLARVVNKERPDLERTKTQLIVQNNDFVIKLKGIEDTLLYKLATAEGDLTEDLPLIESLEEAKRVADEITAKVAEARDMEVKINLSREKYRPVASRGALLFFLLNGLTKIHAFYAFSLNAFIVVFERGIDLAPGGRKKPEAKAEGAAAEGGEAAAAAAPADGAPADGEAAAAAEGAEAAAEGAEAAAAEGGEAAAPAEGEAAAADGEAAAAEGEEGAAAPAEGEEGAAPAEGGDGGDGEAAAEGGEAAAPGAAAAEEGEATLELTPEELEIRLEALLKTCTYTVFGYTRRGLFDRDKLIVATLMTSQILLADGRIDPGEYNLLLNKKVALQPPPITDELSNWMADAQWAGLVPLEASLPCFNGLAKDMERNSEKWELWTKNERCETQPLPGDWAKNLSRFRTMLLIRAMRPDRITAALSQYVQEQMGEEYVKQEIFSASEMIKESSPATPIFFILFPGYSPSKEIEALATSLGLTAANGQLTIISMGQGQEPIAESVLDKYTQNGGWVFLDNVHLMQGWIPSLERKLEIAAETGHKDFRCFFSAEPINGAPHAKIVPESILQTCIKISNEPPSDMKSNMRRALAPFSQATFDRSSTEEKKLVHISILFTLCFYHSLLLGRKKFGVGIGIGAGSGLGYCRGYSFNMGDLINCTEVLHNYLEANEKTPWEDLRYMFGEVFYGGHITDAMDRRLCTTYLEVLIKPDLLPGPDGSAPTMELAPGLRAPMPVSYAALQEYVETSLPAETPVIYGLHPNAQLSLLTSEGELLFATILDVTGGAASGGSGGGLKKDDVVRKGVTTMMETLPEPFNMVDIESRVVDKNPYVVCALQEAERMNGLLVFLRRSLEELTMGLDGSLNMSAAMEEVAAGIFRNAVPGSWMAQMSTRVQEVYSLQRWFKDVVDRYEQLKAWTAGMLVLPKSVWLPGLFNPKAFITAVQQTYARANKLPLDVMRFMTEVTNKRMEDCTEYPAEGAYIHGLTMEGARWDVKNGVMSDSLPKELRFAMPVIRVVPVTADNYDTTGYYICPVYVNMQRANVYSAQVSSFLLKTEALPQKWVLASAALLLQDELA